MHEKTAQITKLQLQHDFLKKHAKQFPQVLEMVKSLSTRPRQSDDLDQNIEAYILFLEQQIQIYKRCLGHAKSVQPEKAAYIDGILLTRNTSDAAGISRALGQHYAQLQMQDSKRLPFVQLIQEEGLCFYWQTPEDAMQFAEVLEAHQIKTSRERTTLSPVYLPESMADLPPQEQYQDPAHTTVVRVPHCQVKQVLSLAQYNPFEFDTILDDLYRGKADRMSVLLEERKTNATLADLQESDALMIVGSTYDPEKNLVHVTVGAQRASTGANALERVPPHFIFILDDSGSMLGGKMCALNDAMRRLIPTLPDDAVVSIQPLNERTICYRITGHELKQRSWVDIRATGGTPLLETIASTATLARANPLDVVIADEELDRTMLVVLTDGQPNGGASDTVNKLMQMMQKSQGYRKPDNILSGPTYRDLSYGHEAMPYNTLPLIMGASIGADGDTAFMQELAKRFGTPQGFIRESGNTANDIEIFLKQLIQLQGREQEATIAVTYTVGGQTKSQQVKMRNLFHGFARQVFFELPEGAEQVEVALVNDKQFIAPCASMTQPIEPNYLTEYIFDQYLLLKGEFDVLGKTIEQSQSFESLWATLMEAEVARLGIEQVDDDSGMRRRAIVKRYKAQQDYGDDKAAWAQQKSKLEELERIRLEKHKEWTQAQEDNPAAKAYEAGVVGIEKRIDALLSMMPGGQQALTQEILLLKQTLRAPKTSAGYGAVTSEKGRFVVAQFSQLRGQGQPMEKVMISVSDNFNRLLAAIETNELQTVMQLVQANQVLLNSRDPIKGTPLMAALHTWKLMRDAGEDCQAIQGIFDYLLHHPALRLLQSDARMNTIAHKAAWWGMEEALLSVITEARKRNQLAQLESMRNTTPIGGTRIGERLFDNILFGDLTKEAQESVIQALYEGSWSTTLPIDGQHWDAFTEPNLHFAPDGLTPLMVQLKWLHELTNQAEKAQLRQKIMKYI